MDADHGYQEPPQHDKARCEVAGGVLLAPMALPQWKQLVHHTRPALSAQAERRDSGHQTGRWWLGTAKGCVCVSLILGTMSMKELILAPALGGSGSPSGTLVVPLRHSEPQFSFLSVRTIMSFLR